MSEELAHLSAPTLAIIQHYFTSGRAGQGAKYQAQMTHVSAEGHCALIGQSLRLVDLAPPEWDAFAQVSGLCSHIIS